MNMTDNSLFFQWKLNIASLFANITNALYQQHWTSCYLLWKNFKDSIKTCYNEVNVVLAEPKGVRTRVGQKFGPLTPCMGNAAPMTLQKYFRISHTACLSLQCLSVRQSARLSHSSRPTVLKRLNVVEIHSFLVVSSFNWGRMVAGFATWKWVPKDRHHAITSDNRRWIVLSLSHFLNLYNKKVLSEPFSSCHTTSMSQLNITITTECLNRKFR